MANDLKVSGKDSRETDSINQLRVGDSDSTDQILQKKFFKKYPAMKAIALLVFVFVVFLGAQTFKNSGRLSGEKSNAAYEDFNKSLLEYINSEKGEVDSNGLLAAARERRERFLALMQNNSKQALNLALQSKDREKLPKEVQSLVEERKILEGTFSPAHVDNWEGKNTVMYDAIITSEGYTRLFFTHESNLKAGDHIRVGGVKLGGVMAAEASNLKIESPAGWTPIGVGTKKLAVILINFANDPRQVITPKQTRELIFTGQYSMNAFYREASYGKLKWQGASNLEGDIFGPYTIPDSSVGCDAFTWGGSATDMAQALDGMQPADYTNIMFVLAVESTMDCPWGGIGSSGGYGEAQNYSFVRFFEYIPGEQNLWNLTISAHETGHNIGLLHSQSFACPSMPQHVPLSFFESCTASTYGDLYSVMGTATWASHFHSSDKELMLWLPQRNIANVSSNKTVAIEPIEKSSNKLQVIRIPRDTDNSYYIEFRQPYGFDVRPDLTPNSAIYHGVTIRLTSEHSYYPRPVSAYLFNNVALSESAQTAHVLRVGQEFYDEVKGIKIKVLTTSSKEATVQVKFAPPQDRR